MKRIRTGFVAALVCTVVILSACSTSAPNGGKKGAPGADTKAEPYRIGMIASITGYAAALGGPQNNAAQLFQERINAAGGINGHPLEIVILNDESKPDLASAQAKKLVDQGVLAIVGPSVTPTMLAVIPVVTQAKVPTMFMTPVDYPNYNKEPYLFSSPQPHLVDQTRAVLSWLEQHGSKHVGLILGTDALGEATKKNAEQVLNEGTLKIKATIKQVPIDSKDYTPILSTLRADGADAIFAGITGPGSAIIRRNQVQMGWDVSYFSHAGNLNDSFIKLMGDAAPGTKWYAQRPLVPESLKDGPAKQLIIETRDAYTKRWGAPPEDMTVVAFAYDSLLSIGDALKVSGNDRDKLRAALETQSITTLNAQVKRSATDHRGVNKNAVYLVEWKDGKYQFIQLGE